MNNIPDNPARVAPPESPKTFSNIKKLRSEFLDLYVDDDDMDSSFCEALETHIVESGLLHVWIRMLYTREHDLVDLHIKEVVEDYIKLYIEVNE